MIPFLILSLEKGKNSKILFPFKVLILVFLIILLSGISFAGKFFHGKNEKKNSFVDYILPQAQAWGAGGSSSSGAGSATGGSSGGGGCGCSGCGGCGGCGCSVVPPPPPSVGSVCWK